MASSVLFPAVFLNKSVLHPFIPFPSDAVKTIFFEVSVTRSIFATLSSNSSKAHFFSLIFASWLQYEVSEESAILDLFTKGPPVPAKFLLLGMNGYNKIGWSSYRSGWKISSTSVFIGLY